MPRKKKTEKPPVTALLQAERFSLAIEAEHLPVRDDDEYEDMRLRISVRSGEFAGFVSICTNNGGLYTLMNDLERLYETLSGKAEMSECDGIDACELLFEAVKGGYIRVTGELREDYMCDCAQSLRFAAKFDQTYLKDFLSELHAVFA